MHLSRRTFLPTLLAASPLLIRGQAPATPAKEQNPCIGSWFVTRAVTSLILGIEPGHGVLFLFIENGSFTIGRREWTDVPGGILVQGFPRFRLWASKPPERIRAEMEDFPAEMEVSKGFRAFPLTFFMRRAEPGTLPPNILNRPLPKGWDQPTLPPEWDQTAGKSRPVD